MANKIVQNLLENRSEFLQHLKSDVAQTDEIIASLNAQLNELKVTATNVEELGKKVEHPALIPLGKKIFVNGTIIHTGEYFLDKLAFPESYTTLETLASTLNHLDNKIKKQSELLKKSQESRDQLLERISLFEESGSSNDTPSEIVSDKGVAIKTGDFYEIIEYEN